MAAAVLYVVFSTWYAPGPSPMMGIFSTRELAEEAISRTYQPENPTDQFLIQEWVLDEE